VHACGAKHISKSKVLKTEGFGAALEVEMSKSARRCGAKHISKSKVQKLTGPEHFWTFRCRFAWQAQGIAHPAKSEQNVGVLSHVQKRWQACGV